jgi:gluconate 5-dehydrogenase
MTESSGLEGIFGLQGKVAVVTGGSRGIGRAIALGLAQAGAHVAVASRNEDSCRQVAEQAQAHGVRAVGIGCDTSREQDIASMFERVRSELGDTDILVYSAGVTSVQIAKEASRDELQRMLDVHYLGGITAAQHAAAQMSRKGGGSMVMVTSVWGLGGATAQLSYGGAKAALAQAVRVLAVEWARDGIRVNGLAPGLVDTDMTSELSEGAWEKLVKRIPMRRAAQPSEMAGPALLLCSDAATYMTGQILVADGGERAR